MKFSVLVALITALSPSAFANFDATETPQPSALIGQELTLEILPDDMKFSEEQIEKLAVRGFLKVHPVRYAGLAEWVEGLATRKTLRAIGTKSETGLASYYGGIPSRLSKYTAAHRTLPFGTKLRVTHEGKSVIVIINDRGPFIHGRIVDINANAAQALGLVGKGVGKVTCEVVE